MEKDLLLGAFSVTAIAIALLFVDPPRRRIGTCDWGPTTVTVRGTRRQLRRWRRDSGLARLDRLAVTLDAGGILDFDGPPDSLDADPGELTRWVADVVKRNAPADHPARRSALGED